VAKVASAAGGRELLNAMMRNLRSNVDRTRLSALAAGFANGGGKKAGVARRPRFTHPGGRRVAHVFTQFAGGSIIKCAGVARVRPLNLEEEPMSVLFALIATVCSAVPGRIERIDLAWSEKRAEEPSLDMMADALGLDPPVAIVPRSKPDPIVVERLFRP